MKASADNPRKSASDDIDFMWWPHGEAIPEGWMIDPEAPPCHHHRYSVPLVRKPDD